MSIPEVGLTEATAAALRDKLVDIVFDAIPLSELGGKTLSEALGDTTTKMIGSSGLY